VATTISIAWCLCITTAVLQTPRPRIGYKKETKQKQLAGAAQADPTWRSRTLLFLLKFKEEGQSRKKPNSTHSGKSAKPSVRFVYIQPTEKDSRDFFFLLLTSFWLSLCACARVLSSVLALFLLRLVLLCHTKRSPASISSHGLPLLT